MPPTATWQAAIHQSEDTASKYLMLLAASECRSATAATWWQLVWAAAGLQCSRPTAAGVKGGAPWAFNREQALFRRQDRSVVAEGEDAKTFHSETQPVASP